jgi:flagellar biosynthetic protein FliR
MTFYAEKFVVFMLVFIRTLSMFATAPMYGHQSVPAQLKIWAGAAVAFAIFPLIAANTGTISLDLGALVVLAVQEVIVGSSIGFTMGILFYAVSYAGEIFGIEMGLSISSLIDPQSGVNVAVIGQFESIVAVFIFLIMNGHLFLLEALKMSYDAVPVSGLKISGSAVDLFIHLTGMVFVAAIKIGAPVIISLFLTDVLLGIIAKMVPQVNVFFVGMPLTVGIGLVLLIASLPFFVFVFGKLIDTFEAETVQLLRLM